MDISVVVPLFNEEESLGELNAWVKRVCTEHSLSYEIIFVDDGSTDRSWSIIENLSNASYSSSLISTSEYLHTQSSDLPGLLILLRFYHTRYSEDSVYI